MSRAPVCFRNELLTYLFPALPANGCSLRATLRPRVNFSLWDYSPMALGLPITPYRETHVVSLSLF